MTRNFLKLIKAISIYSQKLINVKLSGQENATVKKYLNKKTVNINLKKSSRVVNYADVTVKNHF